VVRGSETVWIEPAQAGAQHDLQALKREPQPIADGEQPESHVGHR
jgi:hypothetical protein